jgi:hypothetical protein
MKTFQQFVREYTQAELDAEAKKVDTRKPIQSTTQIKDMHGKPAIEIPGSRTAQYVGRKLIGAAVYGLRGTNPITGSSTPTPGGKRPY